MPDVLNVEIDDRVALLTLNRPDRLNVLDNELLAAIMAALDSIELDPAVHAVLLG